MNKARSLAAAATTLAQREGRLLPPAVKRVNGRGNAAYCPLPSGGGGYAQDSL